MDFRILPAAELIMRLCSVGGGNLLFCVERYSPFSIVLQAEEENGSQHRQRFLCI